MTLRCLSDSDLEILAKMSPTFGEAAARELAARRQFADRRQRPEIPFPRDGESACVSQCPAVGAGVQAPEGPGTDGNKPLMRNRSQRGIRAREILPGTFL